MAQVKPSRKSYLPFAIIAAVLLAAIGAGWWMWRAAQERQATASSNVSGASTATTGVPATTGANPPHAKGNERAAVTLEEFADLQCPLCATTHTELQKVLGEYGSRIRFVYRHYPLAQMHRNALAAAAATEAAALQGKFWEMQDTLYRNQQAWSEQQDVRQIFYDYARTLNMDADRFMRDMRAPDALRRVQADARRGNALGVTGTPTLYINGRQLTPNESSPSGLRVEINKALRSAGQ
jgi:protein-disulfide isomerase